MEGHLTNACSTETYFSAFKHIYNSSDLSCLMQIKVRNIKWLYTRVIFIPNKNARVYTIITRIQHDQDLALTLNDWRYFSISLVHDITLLELIKNIIDPIQFSVHIDWLRDRRNTMS